MELHQLRYLIAVAEEENFSHAAERCHVAQPSLSQQIRKLEDEVGQPLFDRLPRNVALTEAGRRLVEYARRIMIDVADAQRSVAECKGEAAGRLVVGAIPTIAPYVLPGWLAAFQKSHPRVAVDVVEDVTEGIARGVANGEIDLGLVSVCRGGPTLRRELLGGEPLLGALPGHHPMAKRECIEWRDLKRERFLMLHEAHCLSQQVERLCATHAIQPEIVLRGMQLSTVIGMVAAGLGVSLVPRMMVRHGEGPGCVFLPIADGSPERELNLIRNPQRFLSKAVAAFASLIRTEIVGVSAPAGVGNGRSRSHKSCQPSYQSTTEPSSG